MDELSPHHQIVIEQFRWLFAIQANTPHMGGQVNDDVLLGDGPLAGFPLAEVKFLRSRHGDLGGVSSSGHQLGHHLLAEEARSPGHHNPFIVQIHVVHGLPFTNGPHWLNQNRVSISFWDDRLAPVCDRLALPNQATEIWPATEVR
jgi:hypothetical protein